MGGKALLGTNHLWALSGVPPAKCGCITWSPRKYATTTLVSTRTLPAMFIDLFAAFLDDPFHFGCFLRREAYERAGESRFPFCLADRFAPPDEIGGHLQPVRRQGLQILEDVLERAHDSYGTRGRSPLASNPRSRRATTLRDACRACSKALPQEWGRGTLRACATHYANAIFRATACSQGPSAGIATFSRIHPATAAISPPTPAVLRGREVPTLTAADSSTLAVGMPEIRPWLRPPFHCQHGGG